MIFNAISRAHVAGFTRRRRQLSLPASNGNSTTGSETSTSDSQPSRGNSTGSNTDPSQTTASQPAGLSADTPTAGSTRQQTNNSPVKSNSNSTNSSPGATASPLPASSNPQPTPPNEPANSTASSVGNNSSNSSSPTLATPVPVALATPTAPASGSNHQPLAPSDNPAPPLPLASPNVSTTGASPSLSTPQPAVNTTLPISDRPLTAPNATATALSPTLAHSSPQTGLAANDSHGPAGNVSTGVHTSVAPAATRPFSSSSTQGKSKSDSGGLSTGAVTVIAVTAGIVGFIILFWLGVQLLQSKRRKREEADMQEIDFDPSGGGGSANGDTFHALGINRQPSSGASHGPTGYNQKPSAHDLAEKQYDEDAHMYADYAGPPPTTTPLNLTGVGGGADARGGLQQAIGGGHFVQSDSSLGPGSQGFYTLPPAPGMGYYPGDPRQQSYPQASRPDHFSSARHRFDPGTVMPSHDYEYDSNYGTDGTDYSRGVGYGTMIARSTSPPLNFHYPPNSTAATR